MTISFKKQQQKHIHTQSDVRFSEFDRIYCKPKILIDTINFQNINKIIHPHPHSEQTEMK